jgi:hypothetical protein
MSKKEESDKEAKMALLQRLRSLEKRSPNNYQSPEGILTRFRASGQPFQEVKGENPTQFDSLYGAIRRYIHKRGVDDIETTGSYKTLTVTLVNKKLRDQKIAELVKDLNVSS